MKTEHEKKIYSKFLSLIVELRDKCTEDNFIKRDDVKTNIGGLIIRVNEYKIEDIYYYTTEYLYTDSYQGQRENKSEICISLISQFDKIKDSKRRFSPVHYATNSELIVFEQNPFNSKTIAVTLFENQKKYTFKLKRKNDRGQEIYELEVETETGPKIAPQQNSVVTAELVQHTNIFNDFKKIIISYGNICDFNKRSEGEIGDNGGLSTFTPNKNMSLEEIFKLIPSEKAFIRENMSK